MVKFREITASLLCGLSFILTDAIEKYLVVGILFHCAKHSIYDVGSIKGRALWP